MKVLIKNLRKDDNLANTRLVKFKKSETSSTFNVPPVNPGVVKHKDGFNICFLPAPLQNLCEGVALSNTTPLVLRNRFYDYEIDPNRYVKLFYRTTNLSDGYVYVGSTSRSTASLVESTTYHTPNSGNVSIPNEMGITYPRASEFLRHVADYFSSSHDVTMDLDANWVICKPGGYTIGTFIGIEEDEYLDAPSTGVKVELVIVTNGIEENFGTFTFDKTSFENDSKRVYAFFKPKLTAVGWTVTDETRGDGLFFPKQGIKLVKQVPDNTDIYIKLPNSNGTHLRWDTSNSDWDRLRGGFWKIKCTNGDINEADDPDRYSITISPVMVANYNSELGPHKLELITAAEAGATLDPGDYDWVALNYDSPLVLESCYVNVPEPS